MKRLSKSQLMRYVMVACVELASDDQIHERMPSDLNEVHTSELYQPDTEVEMSQMSVTAADVETLLNDLDDQLTQRQGYLLI